MSLQGKVVVVTGAARGMGRAYVQAFLTKGARVVALDRSWVPTGLSGDRDDAFARDLQDRDDVLMVTCDITDDEQIGDACRTTIARFGTVDVLVNNASLRQFHLYLDRAEPITVLETRDAEFQRMFEVNVFGTLKVIRAFIQPMLAQRRGSIINVSSDGGVTVPQGKGIWTLNRPGSREQPYQSSKSALTCLSGYLADEVRGANVAVNVVFPSGTQTTGWEERAATRASATGQPVAPFRGPRLEHVVPLVLHLAEQDASTMTGMIFKAMEWNQANGFGGPEAWMAED